MRLSVASAGTGPNLVMVHGWGMNGAVVEAFAKDLGRSWRVTVLELPGHGHSPWDRGWHGLEEWVDACLAVAPDRACWLGWSLGGLIGLAAAASAPARVLGLRLVNGTPCFTRRKDWRQAVAPEVLESFASDLVVDPAATLQRFLALQVRGSEAGLAVLRAVKRGIRGRPEPHPEALDRGLAILRRSDLRGVLRALPFPSHWLFGERDTLVPALAATEIAAIGPRASVRVVAGAGHALLLSHPEDVRRWLDEPPV